MTEGLITEERASPGRVGIVLVNFNGGKFMPECLSSLAKLDTPNTRIVVVDNASTDGSADEAEAQYPSVAVVRNTDNLGITGGNNAGMAWCRANGCAYVLLLNNDTVAQPDFLSRLLAHAAPNRLLVPKIYFHDNQTLINNHFGSFDYRRGIHRDWFYGKPDSPASGRVQTGTMANTCALLIPCSVVDTVGGMDDRLFMYYDDTDFITRAVRAGILPLFVPDAVLYHKESSSGGGSGSPLNIYYTNRNRPYFMRKHQKNVFLLAGFFLYFFGTRLAVGAQYLRRGQHRHFRALCRALADYCRGRMGYAPPSRYR